MDLQISQLSFSCDCLADQDGSVVGHGAVAVAGGGADCKQDPAGDGEKGEADPSPAIASLPGPAHDTAESGPTP